MINSATLYKLFRSWLLKLFWPWFKKEIWPGLRIYLMELFVLMAKDIVTRTNSGFSRKKEEREEMISRKINEADAKASNSTNQAEIEKQKAIAQVWQEVAEMYRRDNEELQKELEEIRENSVKKAEESLSNLRLNLEKSGKDENRITFSINEKQHQLQLPDPSEMKSPDEEE